jgi:hypothetical protein
MLPFIRSTVMRRNIIYAAALVGIDAYHEVYDET